MYSRQDTWFGWRVLLVKPKFIPDFSTSSRCVVQAGRSSCSSHCIDLALARPSSQFHCPLESSLPVFHKPVHVVPVCVAGMPFRCHVDSVGSGFVTAYGQGLNFGSSGQSCDFVVVGGKGEGHAPRTRGRDASRSEVT